MAAKKHGFAGLIYVSGTQISFANAWSLSISGQEAEVNDFGDAYIERLRGLKDWNGSITAWHDQDSKTLQDAAMAAISVALLLYPDRTDLTTFYSGNAFFDFDHKQDMSSAIQQTANFRADGAITLTGFS